MRYAAHGKRLGNFVCARCACCCCWRQLGAGVNAMQCAVSVMYLMFSFWACGPLAASSSQDCSSCSSVLYAAAEALRDACACG
jgi:hypothetical protein